MEDDLLPIPIPRQRTQASQLQTFDAAAPAPGSAEEVDALKNSCYKLINWIHTNGMPYIQQSQLSLQYLTTLKIQLENLARKLQIGPLPVEPDLPFTTPYQPRRTSFPVQNTKPPSPPRTPPNGHAQLAPQQSRPTLQRRQTTNLYTTPAGGRARRAYDNGIESGILDFKETTKATYEKANGWVLVYGGRKERRTPFKWFFNEGDQRSLHGWRVRFEEAQAKGGNATEMIGRAFAEAHPVVYYSGRYVRLGRYADRNDHAKGYTLAT